MKASSHNVLRTALEYKTARNYLVMVKLAASSCFTKNYAIKGHCLVDV